ncbi:hypothetical protein E0539_11695 [Salmonella enterica subsp. enterica serovar Tilene]|uniref:hypothetical protein n=1 Tax=Salmonella enterica TaxID=28901 RepID=UPI00126B4A4E|nr:hypothetical protein [Salmonella enterica]EBZ5874338.1 hypothetical protein [Salmonella enterica subsp. enterica serovar Millesi]ECF1326698.1 hypothetical protein [Salmonella enterica subsp. enterica serovar Tilene]EEL5713501.1 hypothetical protein [Salmonella enterica subsp. enterica serovar Rubislaw]HCB5333306.1 hypothetical protein [Salmonella enterica subsp. enterica serovar Rubislaw]HCB5341598.1 hypothetical protein [Salmonella enterica subsp. enterica serovar Rubislaw]
MVYVLSRDTFLIKGFSELFNEDIIHLKELKSIKQNEGCSIIIDMLTFPNCLENCLLRLRPQHLNKIIFLCSFSVQKIKYRTPICFIHRNIKHELLSTIHQVQEITTDSTLPSLTLSELNIIKAYLAQKREEEIAAYLGISVTLLRFYKYQLMLKLKLKKMSHILQTEHAVYIIGLQHHFKT